MEVDRGSAEVWASWFRCLGDASRVLLPNRLARARRPMTVGELVAEALNERCLEHFPSAAELIMGVLPRYEPPAADCAAPWQEVTEGEEPAGTGRGRNGRGGA